MARANGNRTAGGQGSKPRGRGRGSSDDRSDRPSRQRDWTQCALAALDAAGHRSTRPRRAVVEALGARSCLVTAPELAAEARAAGRPVGIATVYRTLDRLTELGLVQRVEAGERQVAYEPAGPGDEHHHHLVCERCTRVVPFEDADLERSIARAARRLEGRVHGHEVTFRGMCASCARGAA